MIESNFRFFIELRIIRSNIIMPINLLFLRFLIYNFRFIYKSIKYLLDT
jgi:hypothetical protein